LKPSGQRRSTVSFLALIVALVPLLASCERKPTAAEIEESRRAAEATPAPTPKPGEWMYDKNRKTKLDAPAR
jgi:hypothetical protein